MYGHGDMYDSGEGFDPPFYAPRSLGSFLLMVALCVLGLWAAFSFYGNTQAGKRKLDRLQLEAYKVFQLCDYHEVLSDDWSECNARFYVLKLRAGEGSFSELDLVESWLVRGSSRNPEVIGTTSAELVTFKRVVWLVEAKESLQAVREVRSLLSRSIVCDLLRFELKQGGLSLRDVGSDGEEFQRLCPTRTPSWFAE